MILSRVGVLRGFSAVLLVLLLSSCGSNKKIHYLQNAQAAMSDNKVMKYENVLQPDDNLIITVTADRPELVKDYNLLYLNMRSSDLTTMTDPRLYSYEIDQEGNIEFPTLGKIKVAGLTRTEAESKIKGLLNDYVKSAEVSLRVLDFKVSVMGEVAKPGVVNVNGDRMTILEALSFSGDLTIYGDRKSVTVLREINGVKTINEVDLTQADFINSPYYYLAHNDVIYVKPNKTRVNSSVIGPNVTVAISAISLLITIIALSTR